MLAVGTRWLGRLHAVRQGVPRAEELGGLFASRFSKQGNGRYDEHGLYVGSLSIAQARRWELERLTQSHVVPANGTAPRQM